MTTDNQKKYEEAAKAHIESLMGMPAVGMRIGYHTYSGALYPCFLAGASFAEKEGWNAAIQKAIERVQDLAASDVGYLTDELEKLKI